MYANKVCVFGGVGVWVCVCVCVYKIGIPMGGI